MFRNYLKEEEFLDEFYNWASTAALAVEGAWHPNYSCDDNARRQRDYFLKSGELSSLAFMSAAVQDDGKTGVHAQILLESSARIVNVKVEERDGKPFAQVLIDRKK